MLLKLYVLKYCVKSLALFIELVLLTYLNIVNFRYLFSLEI
jgi:hypothetical protein